MATKRIQRSGVTFTCPECGKLWKDDNEHAPILEGACLECGSDLRLVGKGTNPAIVGDADWFRCTKCSQLYMRRRGELVKTRPRAGFTEFTEF